MLRIVIIHKNLSTSWNQTVIIDSIFLDIKFSMFVLVRETQFSLSLGGGEALVSDCNFAVQVSFQSFCRSNKFFLLFSSQAPLFGADS